MSTPRLTMTGVHKSFPGVKALDGANLTVAPGEVHCVLGANGAGKSTLMKVLAGAYRPDEGEIRLDGELLTIASPAVGLRAGVSVIYQELDLVPDMTVGQNLLLGRVPTRLGVVRRRERDRIAAAALARVGAGFGPDAVVRELSVADQQLTAIAKALTFDARVIVMDEPSATLTTEELVEVMAVIRALTSEGRSVIYISHRLDEVFEVGDRATVMRDGRTIDTFEVARTTEAELVSAMIGRHTGFIERHEREGTTRQPLLEVRRAVVEGLIDVGDLTVYRGEIVGLAGLAGSGRTTFLRALFGLERAELDVGLSGERYAPRRPSAAITAGVGLVPENRKEEGLVLERSVTQNLNLAVLGERVLVTPGAAVARAVPLIDALQIRTSGPHQAVGTLSGGNQQKVVLGKWIQKGVQLLLLDEPSRGLDVGAKESLYREIRALADQGRGCLVASSELPELLANCDRIVVFHAGRITAVFDADGADADAVHHAVITGRKDAA